MPQRMIIVPGDNAVLRALPEQLGQVDVQLLETANDALWEVRNSAPDLIIADIDLPGMSGLDLAEILPNFGLPTRMILCSRQLDPHASKQALSLGVVRFLDGPLTLEACTQVVSDVLHAAASAAASVPAPEAAPEPVPAAPDPAPAPRQRAPEPAPAAAEPAARPRSPESLPERPRRTPAESVRPAPAVAAPPPPPPSRRTNSRRGSLVLTADNLTPVRSRMSELLQEVGALCILLSNREGMVLLDVGTTSGIPTMGLMPLLSTSFSAAGQISQMLRERDSSALYMQEGSHFDLYCFDVAQQFMLVVIFDKASSATKIGTAWVYAKRAIRDMLEYLA